jgi:hypothetical protein
MSIAEFAENLLSWMEETWPYWLVSAVVILAGYCLYWYLFEQRTYRAVGGKAQVKHGRLGHWEDLEEHLKKHHIDINQLGR